MCLERFKLDFKLPLKVLCCFLRFLFPVLSIRLISSRKSY